MIYKRLITTLLGIYLFVYPWSIVLVSFDMVPSWGTWMGGFLLMLQGTLLGIWLVAHTGFVGIVASAIILVVSWLVEHIGTTTGFPFGAYTYTDVLYPKIVNEVPLAIPFAWLLVIPASLGVTDHLTTWYRRQVHRGTANAAPTNRAGLLVRIVGTATCATLLDITIEPVSVHVSNYWVWHHTDGWYYGVPLANFVAWWATSLLLATTTVLLTWRSLLHHNTTSPPLLMPWLPSLLYLLNLIMFLIINATHGYSVAAMMGILLMGFLLATNIAPTQFLVKGQHTQ